MPPTITIAIATPVGDAVLEQLRHAHAGEREDAADREVEAADEQHEGQPDADDQQHAFVSRMLTRLSRCGTAAARTEKNDDQDQQHVSDAEVGGGAPGAARRPGGANEPRPAVGAAELRLHRPPPSAGAQERDPLLGRLGPRAARRRPPARA